MIRCKCPLCCEEFEAEKSLVGKQASCIYCENEIIVQPAITLAQYPNEVPYFHLNKKDPVSIRSGIISWVCFLMIWVVAAIVFLLKNLYLSEMIKGKDKYEALLVYEKISTVLHIFDAVSVFLAIPLIVLSIIFVVKGWKASLENERVLGVTLNGSLLCIYLWLLLSLPLGILFISMMGGK